jgi:hypothetical protein
MTGRRGGFMKRASSDARPPGWAEGGTRNLLRSITLLLTLFAWAVSDAQITLTASDVSATLAAGRTVTSRTDTSTHTADIGSLGATSWDFSALKTNFNLQLTNVQPDTTPFFSYFPASTNAERYAYGIGTLYTYLTLGSNLLLPGTGTSGTFAARTVNSPPEIIYQLPMTLGTSWSSVYVDSTIVTLPDPLPPQITVTSYTATNTVDAYGSLTMPGGGVYQAIRLKTDRRPNPATTVVRTITYTILAENGASVTVLSTDTLQADHGTINVSSISWTAPITSGVRLTDPIPEHFALEQNYPNPFNPSTTIQFDLPRASSIKLVVVNLLGEEVAEVASGEFLPGSYRETFNAANLPSGVYFYRLQTPEVSLVKRMMLIR